LAWLVLARTHATSAVLARPGTFSAEGYVPGRRNPAPTFALRRPFVAADLWTIGAQLQKENKDSVDGMLR